MSEKKHILVITTSFPDGEPGSEAAGSFVSDFVQELSEHVKVTVVAPSCRRMAAEEWGNLTVRSFPVPRLPLSLLSPFNPFHWISILKVMSSGKRVVNHAVMEAKIDHIVALWALPSGYWARDVSRKNDIPYSTWALGSDIWNLGRVPVVKSVLKKVLKGSQVCFADGFQLKSEVETISDRPCEFLASARKLHIEGKKKLSSSPPYRLAFLGRWHPNKGVDLLLDSLKMLGDEDWRKIEEVRICGGGPLEEAVRSDCELLKSEGRPVLVKGYLGKAEAADLLMWADYLLLPSRMESIPVVFSDAMQSECPLIAMPVGDLPLLLNKYNVGITADRVSADAFVRAIRLALRTSPVCYMGNSKGASEYFGLASTVRNVLKLLDS